MLTLGVFPPKAQAVLTNLTQGTYFPLLLQSHQHIIHHDSVLVGVTPTFAAMIVTAIQ